MSEDETWSVDEAISNLKNAMKESNQTASDIFASIDTDDDGEINGPELYKGLVQHLGSTLSPGQVSMIIKGLGRPTKIIESTSKNYHLHLMKKNDYAFAEV
jgi:Ca2+-binding EF-hand superfamily protein